VLPETVAACSSPTKGSAASRGGRGWPSIT
jgi:hypothetical protein